MAMLTHDFQTPVRPSGEPAFAQAEPQARTISIKWLILWATSILLAGAGIAAIMALRIAVYFARYNLWAG